MESKKSTAKNYEILLAIFNREFGDRELESITSDEIMVFLNRLGEGTRQATKKFRYALPKAFFNFLRNTIDEDFPNPCDTRIPRKIFREPRSIDGTSSKKTWSMERYSEPEVSVIA